MVWSFAEQKMQSDEVSRMLIDRGYNSEAIHGDLAQKQRELILHKLREKRISILVATDVAARGIDVQDLTHVINYTIPQTQKPTYIELEEPEEQERQEVQSLSLLLPK